MADRPVILQASHIQRAMSDPNFYALLPEFLPVKRKIEALHVDVSSGCSDCRRRRVSDTVNSDFVSILNSLSADGLSRLKRYIGAGRLLVRAMDGETRKAVLKEI